MKMWGEIVRLSAINKFKSLKDLFMEGEFASKMEKIYGSISPHLEKFP